MAAFIHTSELNATILPQVSKEVKLHTSELNATILPQVSKAVKLSESECSISVFKNTQFLLRALHTATPFKASTLQTFGRMNSIYICKFVDTASKNLELGISSYVMKPIKNYI
jgi:methionyl-tRNA formyltransferase